MSITAGDIVKKKRIELGVTELEVASYSDISIMSYRNFEDNKTIILERDILERICKKLELNYRYFIDYLIKEEVENYLIGLNAILK